MLWELLVDCVRKGYDTLPSTSWSIDLSVALGLSGIWISDGCWRLLQNSKYATNFFKYISVMTLKNSSDSTWRKWCIVWRILVLSLCSRGISQGLPFSQLYCGRNANHFISSIQLEAKATALKLLWNVFVKVPHLTFECNVVDFSSLKESLWQWV